MQDFSKAEVSRNHNNSFKASIKSALEFIDKLSSEYQTSREELEVHRKERAAIIENLIQTLKTNKIKIDKPLGKCNNAELNEELLKVINDMDFIERENFQCDLIKINNRYAKIMELGRKLDELSNQLGTIHIPEDDYDDELVIDFGTPIKPYKVDKYDVTEEVTTNNEVIVDTSVYLQEEPTSLEEEIIKEINPDNIISDHIDEIQIEEVIDDTPIEIDTIEIEEMTSDSSDEKENNELESIIEEENISELTVEDYSNDIVENNDIQDEKQDIVEESIVIPENITNSIDEISIDEILNSDDEAEANDDSEFEENSSSSMPFIIEEKSLIEKIVDTENKIIDNITSSIDAIISPEPIEEENTPSVTKEVMDDNDLINQYLDSIQTVSDEILEPTIEENDNEDFLFYEITNNVTLEEIAESVYEDSKLWKELYNYDVNKEILDRIAKSKKKSIKEICTTPGDLNNVKLKFPVELITYEEIIVEK